MLRRQGFTLVEILVAIAIIAILVSVTLPAVQNVREAARRTHCLNNLRQIGLATITYHDTKDAFPPSRISSPRDALLWEQYDGAASWLVRILPFVEQNNLYKQWDFQLSYDAQLDVAVNTPVPTFICTARRNCDNALCDDRWMTSGAVGGCG